MSATAEAVAPVPQAPQAPPPSDTAIDLDAMRAARAKGERYDPTPKPALDPETAADADLREAVDEIEKPNANETPEQAAERTLKHQFAATKSSRTRYKNQRDEARSRLSTAEAELAEWRSGKRTHQPSVEPVARTESAPKGDDTTDDPEPTLKDFPLEKFKDADDPYAAQGAALAAAVGRWAARDERRKQETADRETRQRESTEREQRELARAFDESFVEARTRIPDFDAVVSAASFARTPATPALLDLVMRSDVKADLAYHFAKHPDLTNRLLASTSRDALLVAFAEVQAEVRAALKASKEKPKPPVHAAQEPVQPVTSGPGTGATLRNPLKDAGSSVDLDEVRRYRKAAGV